MFIYTRTWRLIVIHAAITLSANFSSVTPHVSIGQLSSECNQRLQSSGCATSINKSGIGLIYWVDVTLPRSLKSAYFFTRLTFTIRLACLYVLESRNSREPQNNSNDFSTVWNAYQWDKHMSRFLLWENCCRQKQFSEQLSRCLLRESRDIQLGRHILWPTELNNLLTYFMTTGRGPLLLIMTADDNGWSDRAFFESLWNSMAISHQIREVW